MKLTLHFGGLEGRLQRGATSQRTQLSNAHIVGIISSQVLQFRMRTLWGADQGEQDATL